jgi:hypothetical protein
MEINEEIKKEESEHPQLTHKQAALLVEQHHDKS